MLLSISVCHLFFLPFHPPVCYFICLSFHPPVCSPCYSIRLSAIFCLSFHPPVCHFFACPSVHMSIFSFACPSINIFAISFDCLFIYLSAISSTYSSAIWLAFLLTVLPRSIWKTRLLLSPSFFYYTTHHQMCSQSVVSWPQAAWPHPGLGPPHQAAGGPKPGTLMQFCSERITARNTTTTFSCSYGRVTTIETHTKVRLEAVIINKTNFYHHLHCRHISYVTIFALILYILQGQDRAGNGLTAFEFCAAKSRLWKKRIRTSFIHWHIHEMA